MMHDEGGIQGYGASVTSFYFALVQNCFTSKWNKNLNSEQIETGNQVWHQYKHTRNMLLIVY